MINKTKGILFLLLAVDWEDRTPVALRATIKELIPFVSAARNLAIDHDAGLAICKMENGIPVSYAVWDGIKTRRLEWEI